jgi:hypothetical protein
VGMTNLTIYCASNHIQSTVYVVAETAAEKILESF